jgi:purine-binding chemotaxis protein CheW
MDIAKIRKKALSKKLEEDAEKASPPADVPASEIQKEDENPGGELMLSDADSSEEDAACTGEESAVSGTRLETADAGNDSRGEAAEEMDELLTFSISHEEYAFRVMKVEEVLRLQQITAIPAVPDYVLGITSLRGKIIPVINLQKRLNLDNPSQDIPSPADPGNGTKQEFEKKIVIISGPRGLIGATIDRVMGVVRLPRNKILPPPGHLDEAGLKFIEGIIVLNKRFISVVDSDSAMDVDAG